MCCQPKTFEFGNVLVAFTRDESIRATEVVIINRNEQGEEIEGFKTICYDNGKIRDGTPLVDYVDLV